MLVRRSGSDLTGQRISRRSEVDIDLRAASGIRRRLERSWSLSGKSSVRYADMMIVCGGVNLYLYVHVYV